MEYSKCPLKKRPIFVIKEEELINEEDGPIDLTTKKPMLNIKRNSFHYQKFEIPINFSNRLETIKEEDYQSPLYNETENYLNAPQDLSSRDGNNFENSKNFKSIHSLNSEGQYESNTINLSRNYNNNIINQSNENEYETSYIKTLRTSPISPNNTNYIDSQYIEIEEEIMNEPQDLTIKPQIKPTILAVRNPNVINEMSSVQFNMPPNSPYNQNDSYYRCNTCTKCYSTYSGLIKHQQTHVTNNEHNYINVIENTIGSNILITPPNNTNSNSNTNSENPNLQQRVANIHRYQCKDCGKSYSTCSGLTKHQQFHCPNAEGNQVKKVFSCKNCDKVYVSLGALKMHIRTHTLPCKCPQCGKAFSRPWLLQGHIRTHTGEKPFSCQHCNRAFADRSNLRAHLQTHSDVKKYSCTSCTKTFSRMSLLGKHLQSGCPGTIKLTSSPESADENSSHSYQNHNDYTDNVDNNININNSKKNNNNNNNNNINNIMYAEQHQINKQMNTGNIQYFNSVIKGPINYETAGQHNYQQIFESY